MPRRRIRSPVREPFLGASSWRSHALGGALTCALAVMPTSIAEFALLPAVFAAVIHRRRTWASWKAVASRPLAWAVAAWVAWGVCSLFWSRDRALAIDEVGMVRWLVLTLALIPLADRRAWLVAGLLAGFGVGHIVQVLNAWAILGSGPDALAFNRASDRLSGWWDPAVAGTLLTVAFAIYLRPALLAKGWRLWAGLAGTVLTGAALLATGSRGGWVAAGLLFIAGLFGAGVVAIRDRRLPRGAVILFAGMVIGIAGMVSLRGEAIRQRLADVPQAFGAMFGADTSPADAGRVVVTRWLEGRPTTSAIPDADYDSADGARLLMKLHALDAVRQHPIAGVGAGGYGAWRAPVDPAPSRWLETRVHDHAHDTWLHEAATRGVIGLALLVTVAAGGLASCRSWARHAGLRTFAGSTALAWLGLLLVTPFDTLHVSASSAAVSAIILAFVLMPPTVQSTGPGARRPQPDRAPDTPDGHPPMPSAM